MSTLMDLHSFLYFINLQFFWLIKKNNSPELKLIFIKFNLWKEQGIEVVRLGNHVLECLGKKLNETSSLPMEYEEWTSFIRGYVAWQVLAVKIWSSVFDWKENLSFVILALLR